MSQSVSLEYDWGTLRRSLQYALQKSMGNAGDSRVLQANEPMSITLHCLALCVIFQIGATYAIILWFKKRHEKERFAIATKDAGKALEVSGGLESEPTLVAKEASFSSFSEMGEMLYSSDEMNFGKNEWTKEIQELKNLEVPKKSTIEMKPLAFKLRMKERSLSSHSREPTEEFLNGFWKQTVKTMNQANLTSESFLNEKTSAKTTLVAKVVSEISTESFESEPNVKSLSSSLKKDKKRMLTNVAAFIRQENAEDVNLIMNQIECTLKSLSTELSPVNLPLTSPEYYKIQDQMEPLTNEEMLNTIQRLEVIIYKLNSNVDSDQTESVTKQTVLLKKLTGDLKKRH